MFATSALDLQLNKIPSGGLYVLPPVHGAEREETIDAEYVDLSAEEEVRIEEGSGEMPAKDEL